ncbi:MAG: YceI family protein [Deltaproteobacteria bacterium]|nr:MAG: YceI family protein [Deltaproteobacteria bacterium]
MNTRNMLTGFFLVLAVLTEGAIALSSTKGNNSVTVLARGPAGLRIEGKGSEVSLEEDDSALTFKVPLAPIETGISLRDVHLHQMLEADKYPAATLRISRSQLTFPREREPVEQTAEGGLTLHGQSRTVKVHYRAELGAGGVTMVRGSFQLDMRDFDIKVPSYLGVSVAPKVEVSVELALTGAGARPQHAEGGNEVR